MCFFPWTGVVFPGTSISSRSTRIPIVKLKQKFRLRESGAGEKSESKLLLLYISNMFHILNFSIICRLVDLRTRQQKSLIPPDNCQVTSRSHHGFVNTAQLQNVQIGTYGVKQKPQCVSLWFPPPSFQSPVFNSPLNGCLDLFCAPPGLSTYPT